MIINIKSGMKKRVTKQKQIILETIRKDRSHPTMADIYKKVQNKNKKIGQATVYRNINELVESNEVEKITDLSGQFHFDGNEKRLVRGNIGQIPAAYHRSLLLEFEKLNMYGAISNSDIDNIIN